MTVGINFTVDIIQPELFLGDLREGVGYGQGCDGGEGESREL